jgi:hypothetical protein
MEVFDSINCYLELTSGIWTDVTSDVLDEPRYRWGFNDVDINTRTAGTGICNLSLDNSQFNSAQLLGYYSPGHVNCRVGFKEGIQVKIEYTYDGELYDGWIGRIDSILPDPNEKGMRRTRVTAIDYMDKIYNHEVEVEPETNKDFCGLVALVLANMPIQPADVTYNTCESTFPYVLDAQDKNKAINEFNYGARSEFGLAYLRRGENLVIEGRNTRANLTYNSEVPVPTDTAGYLQMHDGSYLLTHDGYKIIISDGYEVDLTSGCLDMTIDTMGVASVVTATGYPRKVDSAATTLLFDLPSPITIGAGETLTGYVGRYKDPSGVYRIVNGVDMVSPVATTHYLLNSAADGSGTNLTANLTVTATYYADKVSYVFVNSGAAGYITLLKAYGKGIYFDNPFSYQAFSQTAMDLYGSKTKSIDMKYQGDTPTVQSVVNLILSKLSEPRRYIKSIKFNANRSQDTMLAFLNYDIGSRIRLAESVNGIDENSFIMGVDVEILKNKRVNFTYLVRPSFYDVFLSSIWDGIGGWDNFTYGWAD